MAITETPPTDPAEWATSGDNVETPSADRILSGWAAGEIPAATHMNWILNLLGQWTTYLWGRAQTYATLQALYAGITDGSTAQLHEPVADYWGQELNAGIDSTTRATHLAGNGPFLVVATSAGEPRVIARTTAAQGGGATTLFTLTRNTSATNSAIKCRGDYCAVASGNRVDLFVVSTGVRLWSYNHGAQVYDADIFGDSVYFGGVTSGGVRAGRISIGAGTLTTGYDPGATVYSVCAMGDGSVALIGTSSTAFGGTHGLELVEADLATVRWTRSNAALASVKPRSLATDGRALYVGGTTGYVSKINLNDGSTTWTFRPTSTGPQIQQIAVDHGGVYAVADDGAGDTAWSRLDKATGGLLFVNTAVGDLDSVYADGAGVFVGQDSANALTSVVRGNRPGTWARISGAQALWTPYPWLTQPVGEE